MADVAITLAPKTTLPLQQRIAFAYFLEDPAGTAEQLGRYENIEVDSVAGDHLLLSLTPGSRYAGAVLEDYRRGSFVIDLEEDSTAGFVEEFRRSAGSDWQLLDLEAHVNAYVTDPTYVNGFDIASVVASTRSGDCTEYAVLLAALARALGLPARVMIGTVVMASESEVRAAGHAWTEVWQDDAWHSLDAALHQIPAKQRYYVPVMPLDDEGPSYAFSLMYMTAHMATRISGVRSAADPDKR